MGVLGTCILFHVLQVKEEKEYLEIKKSEINTKQKIESSMFIVPNIPVCLEEINTTIFVCNCSSPLVGEEV